MTTADWLRAYGETAQYAVFFLLLGVLVVAERVWPRRTGPWPRARRWRANFGLTLLNVLAIGALPVSFIAAAAWAERSGFGLLHQVTLPAAALVAANLLLRAFISFATHLLMHKVPLFWRVHRVHHLDPELDVSTTVRFHPLEFAIGPLVGVPLVVAFGLTPWILLGYELLDVAITLFSHANLRLPPALDRVLRLFVVTPELHRVHHSTLRHEADSNFGAVFPIWDLLLGTYRTRTAQDPGTMPLGLAEVRGPRAASLLWLLSVPFRGGLSDAPSPGPLAVGARASEPAR